jgi:hypothetical protein
MGLIVVTGPPASGKSTWVRQHAKPGDIVVDWELIARALTPPGADTTSYPRALREVASRARTAATQEALQHADCVDVYIVHAMPTPNALARYAEHDARIVTVDPGRDVVMRRIAETYPASTVAMAERWYASFSHVAQTAQTSSRAW